MVGNNFWSNIDPTFCNIIWSVDFVLVLVCLYPVGEGWPDRDIDVTTIPGLHGGRMHIPILVCCIIIDQQEWLP